MMATDDPERALTIVELNEASVMGMDVITCLYCKRPSLWIRGSAMPVAPLTCGRRKCLEAHAEGLK